MRKNLKTDKEQQLGATTTTNNNNNKTIKQNFFYRYHLGVNN